MPRADGSATDAATGTTTICTGTSNTVTAATAFHARLQALQPARRGHGNGTSRARPPVVLTIATGSAR